MPTFDAIPTSVVTTRIHAFTDDALGELDAVGVAEAIRRGELSPQEAAQAAIERVRAVEPHLHAVVVDSFDAPRYADDPTAALFGVPTFVKDNTDVAGLPSNHGTEAFTAKPARRDGVYTTQYLSTGLTNLGKSRLPEFGFSASTEFMRQEATHNPWHLDFTVGASSGGSAALVASGAVPIAHANDGGGSIRIPAACAGLVGFKPTRHRHIDGEQARHLPINMVSEGVVTRTVRDTAAFVAASEDHWRNRELPPVGLVRGPADRRLRVGLVIESVNGAPVDAETRAAVERTASVLEKAGHVVEPLELPFTSQFEADFVQYWGLLAHLNGLTGRLLIDRSFDTSQFDGLTKGLAAHHRANLVRTPGALRRLKRAPQTYARMFDKHEVVLSPVLSHVTPRLGHLSPTVPYDQLIDRLKSWVAYTPLNNIAGTPAISVPAGLSAEGLPIGVELSAAHGDDRTLLELAFLLEAEQPFARIQDE
jgi:amidase